MAQRRTQSQTHLFVTYKASVADDSATANLEEWMSFMNELSKAIYNVPYEMIIGNKMAISRQAPSHLRLRLPAGFPPILLDKPKSDPEYDIGGRFSSMVAHARKEGIVVESGISAPLALVCE